MNIRTLAKKIPFIDSTYRYLQDQRIQHGDSVIIDVCTVCKSNCVYCLHQYEKLSKPEMMDYNLFQITIDIINKEKYKDIYLYQSGEPMLHPWIYRMIHYISEFGMRSIIGTRLNCKIDFRQLAELASQSYKIHFVITIDSIDKVGLISSGINNRLVLDNVREMAYLLKFPNVTYEFISLVTSVNENELDTVKYWLAPLGFTNWYSANIGYYMWRKAPPDNLNMISNYIPENAKYKTRFDVVNGKVIDKFQSCASRIPVINVHGDVSICCHDMLHKTNAGNVVAQDSLRKIIKGDKYQDLLKLSRQRKLDICKSCN